MPDYGDDSLFAWRLRCSGGRGGRLSSNCLSKGDYRPAAQPVREAHTGDRLRPPSEIVPQSEITRESNPRDVKPRTSARNKN